MSAGITVAFQGELGAYSEEAAYRLFGAGITLAPRRDFQGVGQSVARGEVDYGLLPIENTLAGSVVGSYDVLAAEDLTLVGEVITPIHHCVVGVPGATLGGLARVLSHPVALAQCTAFFGRFPGVEAVAVYDTAGAAKEVAGRGDDAVGAIASRAAAERYGLEVLAHDVEDRHDNQTRFLGVARPGSPPLSSSTSMKTALLLETPNTPGSLVRVLLPFASRGINLSKLESRPGAEPWTYRFFMEVEGDAATPAAREALAEAGGHASRLRVLGSFPRAAATL
jgi:prephenate dehydratase